MRTVSLLTSVLVTAFLLPTSMSGASKNPADYPLRVHIYKVTNHRHSYRGVYWIEGEGNANLYEGGMPAGLDFTYNCGERFMHSEDYETMPARWKKPGYSLVVLTHPIGSDSLRTCEWKVDVKDFAYAHHNGHIVTVPAADLQQWMIAHQYDPEHSEVQPAGLPYQADAHP